MQAVHFEYFLDHLRKVPALCDAVVIANENGKWRAVSRNYEIDPTLLSSLRATKSGGAVRRIEKPARAVIRIPKTDVSVVLPRQPKTRNKTLEGLAARLEECYRAATSSFHAHHDELTGVLNRHGLRDELQRNHGLLFDRTPSEKRPEQEYLGSIELVLFAFDIDRFKSVNDSFGHEAGDVVLAAFATRLNDLAASLTSKYSAKFIFGRPGGEEFELIAVGTLTSREINEVGDLLLNTIRQPELPNRYEVEAQQSKRRKNLGPVDMSKYPVRVTASIGVARRKVTASTEDIEHLHSTLRTEADAALYRAKADGRNCMRVHEEIRRKHGKVFAFHTDASLVTIDIGSSVGVAAGQIFDAYYPPFTGNEKIQHGESSSKVLGQYPAVVGAKLAVIRVQRETSTCAILESEKQGPIPIGSRLTYRFNGSLLPLISLPAHHQTLLEPLSKLPYFIQEGLTNGTLGPVCAVSGSFIDESTRERSDLIEELLVSLPLLFPVKTKLFRGAGSGMFAILPRLPDGRELEETLESISDSAKTINATLKIGAFAGLPPEYEGVTLSPESVIFFARAALLRREMGDDKNVRIFDSTTPDTLIYKWRGNKAESENGLIDHQRLRAFGIESPELNNQIGLLVLENDMRDYYQFAEAAFLSACGASSKPVFRANLGLLRAHRGRYVEAFGDFVQAKEYIEEAKKSYLVAYARSALAAHDDGIRVDENMGELLLEATEALTKPSHDTTYASWVDEIRVALKSGRFG